MDIKELKLSEVKPYEKNPRKNDDAVKYVAESIKEFGFKVPLVIDKNGVIVAGHTRYKAAKQLKMKTVPCLVADDLTDEQVRAFRLADNKVAEQAEWDGDLLDDELAESFDIDMSLFGFDDLEEMERYTQTGGTGSLVKKYVAPPYSILNQAAGYWKDRKKEWLAYIHSADGRDDSVLGAGLRKLAIKNGTASKETSGVSIFDPVLMETMIAWFCPEGGHILDPFAGGSVRGLVSSYTGRSYTGVDLRPEQIEANEKNWEEVKNEKDFYGNDLRKPKWICGDSTEIDHLASGEYDCLITCPPYADLEKYSDDSKDLSNMKYSDFLTAYNEIVKKIDRNVERKLFCCRHCWRS